MALILEANTPWPQKDNTPALNIEKNSKKYAGKHIISCTNVPSIHITVQNTDGPSSPNIVYQSFM